MTPDTTIKNKTMKVKEEIQPTGDGARSERQEPGNLRELNAAVGRFMGLEVLGEVICVPNPEDWRLEIPIRARERETDKQKLRPVYLNKCVCDHRHEEDSKHLGHIWLCLRIVPDYSTDIAAAMEVVEKVAAQNWRVHLGRGSISPLWKVELFKTNGNMIRRETNESDSLPEAICRAALALVDTNTTEEVE